MVEEVPLHRQGSTIPVSLHNSESTVLDVTIGKAWSLFKHFKLEHSVPGKVSATTFLTGAPGQIDSVIKIDYTDGAVWQIRVNEISEIRHSIGYEVLTAEPTHLASSI